MEVRCDGGLFSCLSRSSQSSGGCSYDARDRGTDHGEESAWRMRAVAGQLGVGQRGPEHPL